MMSDAQFGKNARRQALLAILAFVLVLAGLTLYQGLSGLAFADEVGFLLNWGRYGSDPGMFWNPNGVAVDGLGNVYVADTENHRIQKFDGYGGRLGVWGGPDAGSGDKEFDYPHGVAVDRAGNVYVADTYNHRIQKFDMNGKFLHKWGAWGSGDVGFKYPYGVAVDGAGYVYVADRLNYRVLKFNSEGGYQDEWGGVGDGNGLFRAPVGIEAGAEGNVYVVDHVLALVQRFDDGGQHVTEWGEFGGGRKKFRTPFGVTLDGDSHVFVADEGNDLIKVYDGLGAYQLKWGETGELDGQFDHPADVAVDAAGNIYVVDMTNHRIQKFSGAAPTVRLNVAKEVLPDQGVALHGQVTYTIVLSNAGVADAWDVQLTDTLPDEVDFGQWLEQPTGAEVDLSGQLTWSDTLTAGEAFTFTFTADHNGDYGDHVLNTAQYTHWSQAGSAGASFTVLGAPHLSIDKTVIPDTAIVRHGQVTYTVVLSNSGETDAVGTLLTDTLPEQVDFAGWVKQPPEASVDQGELTWGGTVTAGQSITFAFVASHVGDHGDSVTNSAEYAYAGSSGAAEASFSVTNVSDLSVDKVVSPEAAVSRHDLLTYTITLRNSGGLGVTGVDLTDTLPAQVGFVRWLRRPPGAFIDENDRLTWRGGVNAGQSIPFIFQVIYLGDGGDEVTNTAEIMHEKGSGRADATFSTVGFVPVALAKTALPETGISQGDPITYTLVLSSTSVRDALDVSLTDDLPAGVVFGHWVTQPPGSDLVGDTVTWNGTVSSGVTIDLSFVVTYTAEQGRTVLNMAKFSHASGGGSAQAVFRTGSFVYLPIMLKGRTP